MKKLQARNVKRIRTSVSAVIVLTIMLSIIMPENIVFLFSLRANAYTGIGEPVVHADIPTYDDIGFKNNLYDGTGALGELPRTVQYAPGHQTAKNISFTDFVAECGTGDSFDLSKAETKKNSGYRIMICNALELYALSRLSNLYDGAQASERDFYLSANYILGNNIEYHDASKSGKYFIPIGNAENNFTGTFDGQGFEIRDLYFVSDSSEYSNPTYRKVKFGMFGYVGQGAEIKNFGLYHPWINYSVSSASVAVLAGVNEGTVSDVYVIVNEYCHSQKNVNKFYIAGATYSAGIIAENAGTLRNSYFAGIIHSTDNLGSQHPVCARNTGTIENCYYDKDVYQYGVAYAELGITPQNRIDNPDEAAMKGIASIDLKRVGFSDNGMQNTSFKALRAGAAGTSYNNASTNSADWLYPRIYGYSGSGTEADPFIISTPVQLINFPYSFEYYSENQSYFRLNSDIDMTEVAEFVYKPQVCCHIVTNSVTPYTDGMTVTADCALQKDWGESYDKGFTNNVFSGEVKDGDNNIFVHHDMGTNSDGQQMQESHIIYKLDIDTPASTPNTPTYISAANIPSCTDEGVSSISKREGDDYYFTGLIGYASGATIQDLQFIGGDVSTGAHDLLKTNDAYNAYNKNNTPRVYVFTGGVAAYSYNSRFNNVHNSSAVKLGTGKQFRSAMGGIVGGGTGLKAENCTNNGNIMGRYKTITDKPNIKAESYIFGGLFGDCYLNLCKNCANHGNIMGVVLIILSDNDQQYVAAAEDQQLSQDIMNANSYYAGVCAGRLPVNANDNTKNTFNDGMIFDAPIVLDENGNPLDTNNNPLSKGIEEEAYDENGKPVVAPKPKAEELPDGYTVLDYKSNIWGTSNMSNLAGIARECPHKSCNKGKMYSVRRWKVIMSGCGGMVSVGDLNYTSGALYYASNYAPLYNFSGVLRMAGICCFAPNESIDTGYTAYCCYNEGNIYVYDGGIVSGGQQQGRDINYITGICHFISRESFNKGNIYVAPSIAPPEELQTNPRTVTRGIYVGGNSGSYARGGSSYRNINAGRVTVDFERYGFKFYRKNTNDVKEVYIIGSGNMQYNTNYGILKFIENENAENNITSLYMYACGGYEIEQSSSSSENFADIYLDVSKGSIKEVYISVFGRVMTQNSMNVGNITFRGKTTNLEISTIVRQPTVREASNKNINLGDVRVTEDSVANTAYIQNIIFSQAQPKAENNMFGYYEGCELPQGLVSTAGTPSNSTSFNRFINSDYYSPTKRYGVFDISGTYGKLVVSGIYKNDYTSNPGINYDNIVNGEYNIHNVIIKNNNGISTTNGFYINPLSFGVFGISMARSTSSKNYAPINVNNVVFDAATPAQAVITGGAGGSKNANYGKITVENIVTSDAATKYVPLFISGLLYNTSGSNMENHGDIEVKNFNNAVVGETTYSASSNQNRVIPIVGGIGNQFYDSGTNMRLTDCVNFGKITIDNIPVSSVAGGIAGRANGELENCINYGAVHSRFSEINTAGGVLDLRTTYAGIVGIQGKDVSNCYNFGELRVYQPTSANVDTSSFKDNLYMGGISGKSGTMRCCQNFGDFLICPGPNTSEYSLACIGGIMGCGGNGTVNSVMNYGSIYFLPPSGNPALSEYATDRKMAYAIGGITGIEGASSERAGAVNYGYVNLQNEQFSQFCTTPHNKKLNGTTNVGYGMYFGGLAGLDLAGGSYSYCINYGGFNDNSSGTTAVQQLSSVDTNRLGALVGSVSPKSGNGAHYIHNVDLMAYKNNALSPDYTFKLFGELQNVSNKTTADKLDPVYNYSLYPTTVNATKNIFGSNAGNIKQVTLDKSSNFDHNKNCESEGLFYGNFVFRRKLAHEESEWSFNGNNLMMYTEFDNLSDFLKSYFRFRFPYMDTESAGAYVVVDGDIKSNLESRSGDSFVPDGIIYEYGEPNALKYNFMGITTNADNELLSTSVTVETTDADFGNLPNRTQNNGLNNYKGLYQLYNSYLTSEGKTRTVFTDLMYFAQQVKKSTMAEVYDSHAISTMRYKSISTKKYQSYRDYIDIVEVHPARDKFNIPGVKDDNGKVPSAVDSQTGDKYVTAYDDVRYTDLFYYVAIDDIDMSAKARRYISSSAYEQLSSEEKTLYTYDSSFNEYYKEVDHNGCLDLSLNSIDLSDKTSNLYVLKENKNDPNYKNYDKISDRNATIENDILSIDTSEMWLKGHNVKEKLEDTSLWYIYSGAQLADIADDNIWKISIPLSTGLGGEEIPNVNNNVYTKIFGVQISEDGKHYNIVRLNVVVDYFSPSALVEAVGVHTDNGYYYSTNSTDPSARKSDIFKRTDDTKRVTQMEKFLDKYYDGEYNSNGHKINNSGVIVDNPADTENYDADYGMKNGIGANNGLLAVSGMPSLTDTKPVYDENGNAVLNDDNTVKEVQKNDVTYYFLSNDIEAKQDDVQNVSAGTVNIQRSDSNLKNTSDTKDVEIWLSTKNMVDESSGSNIWAHVSYQDRVPYLEGYDYNRWLKEGVAPSDKHSALASQLNDDTLWNDAASLDDLDESVDLNDISPEGTGRGYKLKALRSLKNVEDDVTKHSTGYAKISLSDSFDGDIYYGGLYRVDLFYERSKDEGWESAKHFATVFFWKEFSSENAQYFKRYSNANDEVYDGRANWVGNLGLWGYNSYKNTANSTGGYSSGYAAASTTYYSFATAFTDDSFLQKSYASYLSNMNESFKNTKEGLMFAAPSRQREVNDWAFFNINSANSTYSPKAYGSSRRVLLDNSKNNNTVYDGYKTTESDGRLAYNSYKTERRNNQQTVDVYDKVKRDPIFNHVLRDDNGYVIYDDTSDRVYDKNSGVVYEDSNNKGTVTIIGEEYKVNKDSKQSSKVKTLSMKTQMNRIDVKIDEATGDFYPVSYHWQGAVTSEDTRNTSVVDYEVINGGCDSYYGSYNRGNLASIDIVSGSTKKNGFTVTDGKGEIKPGEKESPTFNVQWSSSNVRDGSDKPMYVNGGSTYDPSVFNYSSEDSQIILELFRKDGFGALVTDGHIVRTDSSGKEIPFKIRVYYKGLSESEYTLLTDSQIEKMIDTISYDSDNNWTFKLKKNSPSGDYKFVPYFSYHTDLKMAVDNGSTINLVKYDPDPSVESSEQNKLAASQYTDGTGAAKNVFEWTIAYSPFIIERKANNESYLLEFDVNNDNGMPVICESDEMAKTIPQSSQRETYIITSDEHNYIHYDGYENYETGDERIDKFDITAFVGKDNGTGNPIDKSSLSFKAPYMATVEVWNTAYGESPIDEITGQFDSDPSHWITMDDKIDASFGDENNDYKHYSLVDEEYNKAFDDDPDVKYYSKYYRVVAEDREHTTLYKVNIIPSKRNKTVSFEIAADVERDISQGLRDSNDPIVAEYEESARVYNELVQNYEQVFATIKELTINSDNTTNVEYYETKWFDGETPDELMGTSPYIYNLKAHLYDISTSLPSGYTYDVYVLSPEGDGYMKLLDSGHGLSGKRFIMGKPDSQDFKIRIVLKYEQETHWGVNYLWTPDCANIEERGGKKYISLDGGGLFNNYVYSQRSTS